MKWFVEEVCDPFKGLAFVAESTHERKDRVACSLYSQEFGSGLSAALLMAMDFAVGSLRIKDGVQLHPNEHVAEPFRFFSGWQRIAFVAFAEPAYPTTAAFVDDAFSTDHFRLFAYLTPNVLVVAFAYLQIAVGRNYVVLDERIADEVELLG